MKVFVVGKNSSLYSQIKDLFKNIEFVEKSHKEIGEIENAENILVFSYDPESLEGNRKILKHLLSKKPTKLIYISTTAIYSNGYTRGYTYPRIKKEIENFLFQYNNVQVIRIGLVESFFDPSKFIGPIKYSPLELIVEVIKSIIYGEYSQRIIEAWISKNFHNSNPFRRYVNSILNISERVLKSKFHYTRPLDLILKIFGEQNYGYTFLSNKFEPFSEYVIVGSGMAALGVFEALDEKNKLYNTRLIHAKTSKAQYHESSNIKDSIESVRNGGNSNLWHSVISNFSNKTNNNSDFEFFFKRLYPKSINKHLKTSFSFIPHFPIRPIKKISASKNKLKSILDDTIIYLEKDDLGKVLLHGTKASYSTENLSLCTGSISSLKLFSDSGIIESRESTLSDHLVGYFGQFSGPLKNLQVIQTREGHFKKYHEIKLDNRSLFVTLRPANFEFLNITKANKYRNFFGRSSKSIYFSLLSKVNIGLIIEAIYNKFGIEFNFTGKYNITGHIESKNTVNVKCFPHKKPLVEYTEKEISFSDEEIKSIIKYLEGIGINTDIQINKRTPVSPGLHFLNSSLKSELMNKPKEINFFSTILFNDESPKHPTFNLYINSYMTTIDFLNRKT